LVQPDIRRRFDLIAQLALVGVLVVGCFLVLRPFLVATLFAAIICVSSWPLFLLIRDLTGGRAWLAASIMSLLLVLLVAAPVAMLALSIADVGPPAIDAVRRYFEGGLREAPDWVARIPLVGEAMRDYWAGLIASQEELVKLLRGLIDPARRFAVAAGGVIAAGLVEVLLAVLIAFFFYRDGEALAAKLHVATDRLAGDFSRELLATTRNTAIAVVHGLLGTAIAQAVIATIGFLLAGVPGAFLLGALTFVLSLVPVGPPLVWGGATIWLFSEGHTGWAIFMVAWGALVVSSVDNFLKPLLIGRSSGLPFVRVLLGVFGGVIAFGFVGLFLGPTLLAVGLSLGEKWVARAESTAAQAPTAAPSRAPGPDGTRLP
jgi:predicted PurR-regulated permease PerM